MNFSLRKPMKLRPEMENNISSFSATGFGAGANYNGETLV